MSDDIKQLKMEINNLKALLHETNKNHSQWESFIERMDIEGSFAEAYRNSVRLVNDLEKKCVNHDTLYDFKVINDSALSEIRDLYVSIKREYESKEKLYEERFQANEERFQVNERKLEGINRILDNIISTASAPCAVASFSGGGKRRKKYSKKKKKSKSKRSSKSKRKSKTRRRR